MTAFSQKGIELAAEKAGLSPWAETSEDVPDMPDDPELPEEVRMSLCAPFGSAEIYEVYVARNKQQTAAIAHANVPIERIWDRLDEVLGPEGYQEAFEVASAEPRIVICRLTIGGLTRCGMGEGDTIIKAQDEALRAAALRFGVGGQVLDEGNYLVALSPASGERGEGMPDRLANDAE